MGGIHLNQTAKVQLRVYFTSTTHQTADVHDVSETKTFLSIPWYLIQPCVYEAFGGHGIGELQAHDSSSRAGFRILFLLAQVDDEMRRGDGS